MFHEIFLVSVLLVGMTVSLESRREETATARRPAGPTGGEDEPPQRPSTRKPKEDEGGEEGEEEPPRRPKEEEEGEGEEEPQRRPFTRRPFPRRPKDEAEGGEEEGEEEASQRPEIPEIAVEIPLAGLIRRPMRIMKDLNITTTTNVCKVDCSGGDDDAPNQCELKCRGNAVSFGFEKVPTQHQDVVRGWYWSGENCCCKTYLYLRCPKQIYGYSLVHLGSRGAQCWVEALCGTDCKELCPSRCEPHYAHRTVLVRDRSGVRWQNYFYPAHCKCTRSKCGQPLCPRSPYIG